MSKEYLLYPEVKEWFHEYLTDRYKKWNVFTTYKTSTISLDSVLKSINIKLIDIVGLNIKIDVVGVLRKNNDIRLAFAEVKTAPLTLKDLGQLWGYTQLVNPLESFLLSSGGLGSLDYLFNIRHRQDLLYYGLKKEYMMKICKWDSIRKSVDILSIIPKH